MLDQVLRHPFLTEETNNTRLEGEEAQYQAFISYRVWSDSQPASDLSTQLTIQGHRVWWDKFRLEAGKDWQEGFCDGLVQSRLFIPIVSQAGLLGGHNYIVKECCPGCTKTHKGDTRKLVEGSECDNVMLEYRLALELKERGLIEKILPMLAGPAFDAAKVGSSAVVASIELKLREQLERQGLGAPMRPRLSPKQTFAAILGQKQAISQLPRLTDGTACASLQKEMTNAVFEVFVSCDPSVRHDFDIGQKLVQELATKGVSATMPGPFSSDAINAVGSGGSSAFPLAAQSLFGEHLMQAVKSGVRVVALIVSEATLKKLDTMGPGMPCSSALAVDPLLALELLDQQRLDYLFPVLVAEQGEEKKFSSWGVGRKGVVDGAVVRVRELLGDTKVMKRQGERRMDSILDELFRCQGAFVGGGEAFTAALAAGQLRDIILRMQHDTSTLELTQQLRSEKQRLERIAENEKKEKEALMEELKVANAGKLGEETARLRAQLAVERQEKEAALKQKRAAQQQIFELEAKLAASSTGIEAELRLSPVKPRPPSARSAARRAFSSSLRTTSAENFFGRVASKQTKQVIS